MGAEIKVKALIRAGYTDIVNLGLGQFTEPPPQYIRDAMHRAVDGDLGYTPGGGTQELLEAICYSYEQRGLSFYTPDNVIATTGAKQAFDLTVKAIINPGDVVVIPAPAWLGYEPLVVDRLGVCKFIECNEANDFKVTAAELELELAINQKTKLLILNSPGNPTSSVYTREELEGIAVVLRQHPNVLVYCDEIYRLLSEEEVLNILHVAPDLAGRVISAEGTAKGSGKGGGLRLGTAAGPKWAMERMIRFQIPQTGPPCVVAQAAAIAALTQKNPIRPQWKRLLNDRRNCVYAEAEKTEGITCLQPNLVGGFYGILGCKKLIGLTTPDGKKLRTDADVGEYFIDCAHVVTVPGISFHVNPEKVSFLRVSFGGADEKLLHQGFEQMRTAIAQLR
jgi:aspartate aminotransferase